ncbi:hypothetical protein HX882_13050 [Pseudomonas gingeri]|uniref:Nucleoside-binding outer membrane protein n=1 Tax=Pseudomonas gingeri TaxID=117681 RepID=A0A7Y7XBG9_9PSED|nr:hypothetical protein [Pseudomonas gingeri]NWB96824.1 hypothetical protein [Pseudomonas gingeri]
MRHSFAVPVLVSIIPFVLASTAVAAADFSDTLIGYRYSAHYTEPGNPRDVAKQILQVTHVSSYSLGQNFINLDVFKSAGNDPAQGGGTGATEAYVTYRNQFQYGKVFGTPLAFGPVRDMALTAGFDYNTKNTTFGPNKRMLVLGPTVKLAMPAGFVDVSLYYAREWNHCGLDACNKPGNQTDKLFDPYYQFNVNWGIPFTVGALPLKFQGYYLLNGRKGGDYQNQPTGVEQLMRTSLMLDVGQLGWGAKNVFWIGPGYEYWRNKFGNQAGPGANTDALSLNIEWHL